MNIAARAPQHIFGCSIRPALLGVALAALAVPAAAEDCAPKAATALVRPAPAEAGAAARPVQKARAAGAHRPSRHKVGKRSASKPRRVATAKRPAAPKPAPPQVAALPSAPSAPSIECHAKTPTVVALPAEVKPAAARLLDEVAPPVSAMPVTASPPAMAFNDGFGVWTAGGALLYAPSGGGSPPSPFDEGGTTPGGPPPVSAVPEPGVWTMLIIGFFGLGGAVRSARRARRAAA